MVMPRYGLYKGLGNPIQICNSHNCISLLAGQDRGPQKPKSCYGRILILVEGTIQAGHEEWPDIAATDQ